MQPSTVFAILASAGLALSAAVPVPAAQPNDKTSATGKSGGSGTCNSKNEKAACCNSITGVSVLGGSCTLDILSDTCSSGNVQCCKTDQNGAINVALPCVPINLLS